VFDFGGNNLEKTYPTTIASKKEGASTSNSLK